MNIANKLTLLRVILVPFFAFFMLAGDIVPYSYLWAAVIFAVASITDTADGKIARKYNMVTNFGKFAELLLRFTWEARDKRCSQHHTGNFTAELRK